MNAADVELALTLPSTLALAPARRASRAATMRCMVVTQEERRGTSLQLAGSGEGWSVDIFSTVDEAIRAAFRRVFHLAVVDLESVAGSPWQTDFQELASDLAQNHVSLLVVAGDPRDPLAEFAARQLGVWIYLPGMNGSARLDDIFREARVAVARMASSREPMYSHSDLGKPPDP